MFPLKNIVFEGVEGINTVQLSLSDKPINVLIGANGVGKTKTLEALYTLLLFSNQQIRQLRDGYVNSKNFVFSGCRVNDEVVYENPFQPYDFHTQIYEIFDKYDTLTHKFPVVYLGAQNRGEIKTLENNTITPLGEYQDRKEKYFDGLLDGMKNHFSTLNSENNIEEWFIQRAMSANDYQDENDNREVELLTVLRVLHQIDERISAEKRDFKVLGGKAISILLDGQPRRLSELSSGFSSLTKIVQSIVAGYGFFTNATELEQVEGYVLIDEIESHLHIEWQTKILPLLSKIFPNTRFIITTHSSLVLAQLHNGDAYQLIRTENGVITNHLAKPGRLALIDLLNEAFDVNLNKIKLNSISAEDQAEAKAALLALLGESDNDK